MLEFWLRPWHGGTRRVLLTSPSAPAPGPLGVPPARGCRGKVLGAEAGAPIPMLGGSTGGACPGRGSVPPLPAGSWWGKRGGGGGCIVSAL